MENTTYSNISIQLKSGEELGTVVSSGGHGAEADFAAADVRTVPLAFIDQSKITGMLAGDSYSHAVCPLDYFSSDVKTTLYAKLITKNAGANGIPACGAVMQDKAGTSQGNWYHQGATQQAYRGINESALLAIAHYNLDPSQGIVSVGTDLIATPWLGTQIIFQPLSSGYINREPSQIKPDGHVYCFDGSAGGSGQGHVDILLTNPTTLKIDYASGVCAVDPTLLASALTYAR